MSNTLANSKEAMKKVLISSSPVNEIMNVNYGYVQGLRLVDYENPERSVYFKDDKMLVTVIIPDEQGNFPTLAEQWLQTFGQPDNQLPSIEGKNSWVWVYGQKGLTATVDEYGEVLLVEKFEPMTTRHYEKTLYRMPPVFTK
ncbi:hypothetical protein PN36_29100 [Candidatus Thiomargarita nelsonii]|uniref:Uncharacterized protein n=1 Tax=Candidatus Thiomargarita nelsonii TaxID=1003181 RepID=A0A0A6PAU4_9GAMM|nr:hypothetical protein PN36_29100 [Candidatus Thiomargarita nelsonii]